MLTIKVDESPKIYQRSFEKFAERTLFMKIFTPKERGGKYENLFFEAGTDLEKMKTLPCGSSIKFLKHLPLEVAVNEIDHRSIQYASYYIDEETVPQKDIDFPIQYMNTTVTLHESDVDIQNHAYREHKEFEIFLCGKDLYVVQKNNCDPLLAYNLFPTGYILLTEKPAIAGFVLKELNNEEMQMLMDIKAIKNVPGEVETGG